MGKRTIELVRPKVRSTGRFKHLSGDQTSPRRFSDATFQNVTHTEFTPNLLNIDRFALVGEAGIARDHEQRFKARQRCDDVLHHAVGKILLLGIAAHVLERQDGDRRLVGKHKRRSLNLERTRLRLGSASFTKLNPPSSHRLSNVLERLRPKVITGYLNLTSHLPLGIVRHANSARLSNALQPTGHIDSIAKALVIIKNDISH